MRAPVETGLPRALHDIYTSLTEQRQSPLTKHQRSKINGTSLIIDNPEPKPFAVEIGTVVFLGKDTEDKLMLAAAKGNFPEANGTLAIVGGIHQPDYTFWGIVRRFRHHSEFQSLVNGSALSAEDYVSFMITPSPDEHTIYLTTGDKQSKHPALAIPTDKLTNTDTREEALSTVNTTIFEAAKQKFSPYIPKNF